MRRSVNGQRGDTIIEVLLAITVLGIIVTLAYTVMSRGMGIGYNSLDRTNTQALMNGQASMLRAAHASFLKATSDGDRALWNDVVSRVVKFTSQTQINNTAAVRADGCMSAVTQTQRFFFQTTVTGVSFRTMSVPGLQRIGTQPVAGDGMWIEGYQLTTNEDGTVRDDIYTFYVKSCTPPIYSDGPQVLRQTKTVVRLYVP